MHAHVCAAVSRADTVSLNDGKLYGVDLRFSNSSQGVLAVSVLPYGTRPPARAPSSNERHLVKPTQLRVADQGCVVARSADSYHDLWR